MRKLLVISLVSVLALIASAALAAEPIGRVVAVSGKAQVARAGGGTEKLAFNSPIYLDDKITTEAGSRVMVIVQFNTMLSLGPGAIASIQEARDEKKRSKDSEGVAGLKIMLEAGTARVTVNRTVLDRDTFDKLQHDVFVQTPQALYDLLEGENNDLVIVLPPVFKEARSK